MSTSPFFGLITEKLGAKINVHGENTHCSKNLLQNLVMSDHIGIMIEIDTCVVTFDQSTMCIACAHHYRLQHTHNNFSRTFQYGPTSQTFVVIFTTTFPPYKL